ncbi:MAG: ATP-binding cassette domain-containing protein [Burkholderiales bacterium]
MTPPPVIVDLRDVTFAHPGQAPLFDHWSTAIRAGVTLVQGDTGSGKSTLLRLLAGAEAIGGLITLAGIRLDADAAAYRRAVYFVDPNDAQHEQSVAGDLVGAAARHLAEGFGLAPHLHKPMFMLSTGSRRKVWLAAAIASACPLTLLDEPTGGLDAPSREYLAQALSALAGQRERAIVVASSEGLGAVALAGTIALPLQGA